MHTYLLAETPWNLFLAVLPVFFGYGLAFGVRRFTLERRLVPWPVWLPLGLIWFVFLPNTCYLLTEWRHFLWDRRLPVWADVHRPAPDLMELCGWSLFFLLYSACGVLTFTLGVRPIKSLVQSMKVKLWPVAIPFYLLSSLGVYLGFSPQLNSWDIWSQPHLVFETVWQVLQWPRVQVAVAFFAVVLWLLFEATDMWVEGFKMRLRQWRRMGPDPTQV